MPCLFVRDFNGSRDATITPTVAPDAAWVVDGVGHPFIKRDGTACAVINGALFKRYDAKKGKTPPVGAIPCTEGPDEVTGHWPHWLAVDPLDPSSKHHQQAWSELDGPLPDGTYELCGPSFSANPEGFERNRFVAHIGEPLPEIPRSFDSLRVFLDTACFEGVVWHHPDGVRKAKLRRADFGFAWPMK